MHEGKPESRAAFPSSSAWRLHDRPRAAGRAACKHLTVSLAVVALLATGPAWAVSSAANDAAPPLADPAGRHSSVEVHPLAVETFPASRIVLDAAGRPVLDCAGSAEDKPAWSDAASQAGRLAMLSPSAGSSPDVVAKAHPAAVFEAIYSDPPGSGFFDPTPVAAAPGNPATSLGAQRRAVFDAALAIWATRLESHVPIRVTASFADLGCTNSPAAVGGPSAVVSGFANAPHAATAYPAALATALAGERLPGLAHEATVIFSTRVEGRDCFVYVPDGLWYGLDMYAAPATTAFPFLELALHEIGHGLGLVALVDLETGVFAGPSSLPDVYSRHLYSRTLQRHWPDMTPAERVASRFDNGNLVWSGDHVTQRAQDVVFPAGEVRVPAAGGEAGRFAASFHGFAPYLPVPGLQGALAVADNDTGQPPVGQSGPRAATDACQPVATIPTGSVSVLLATGGGCPFADKWRHAYEAGASAVLVADTREDDDPVAVANIGVALPERYPIPLWSVSASAGRALLAQSPGTVTLGFDTDSERPGMRGGQVSLHSSVSHLSSATVPRLMMGPRSFSGAAMGFPDLGADMLLDIGWPAADQRQAQFSGAWFNPERSGEGCQLTLEGDDQTFILTCYFHLAGEQVWVMGPARMDADVLDVAMHFTRGTGYGPAFDPDEVERVEWGRIRMNFVDCNTAVLDLWPTAPGYSHFQSRLRRIVHGDCGLNALAQPDRTLAGNYFAPERSGEGIQVTMESDGITAVLSWYTYHQGKQLWVIASGALEGDTIDFNDAAIATGADFGRAFDSADVERIAFGDIAMQWRDCNTVELTIDPILAAFESSRRTMTRIVPRQC